MALSESKAHQVQITGQQRQAGNNNIQSAQSSGQNYGQNENGEDDEIFVIDEELSFANVEDRRRMGQLIRNGQQQQNNSSRTERQSERTGNNQANDIIIIDEELSFANVEDRRRMIGGSDEQVQNVVLPPPPPPPLLIPTPSRPIRPVQISHDNNVGTRVETSRRKKTDTILAILAQHYRQQGQTIDQAGDPLGWNGGQQDERHHRQSTSKSAALPRNYDSGLKSPTHSEIINEHEYRDRHGRRRSSSSSSSESGHHYRSHRHSSSYGNHRSRSREGGEKTTRTGGRSEELLYLPTTEQWVPELDLGQTHFNEPDSSLSPDEHLLLNHGYEEPSPAAKLAKKLEEKGQMMRPMDRMQKLLKLIQNE